MFSDYQALIHQVVYDFSVEQVCLAFFNLVELHEVEDAETIAFIASALLLIYEKMEGGILYLSLEF